MDCPRILLRVNPRTVHTRVLDLVGEVSAFLELDEFRDGMLLALLAAVPSDWVSLNQVGPDPGQNWSIVQPPLPDDLRTVFYRLAHQNPLAIWHLRTGDGRPRRLSDVCTAEAFHATDLYREVYAGIGLEHQISFTLPSAGEQLLAVALSRCQHDFSEEHRELLTVARPHLIQIYRNALTHTEVMRRAEARSTPAPDASALASLGLTPAQTRVLSLVATGRPTATVAAELSISERTVQKHLQRIYRHLGVSDRSAATHRAWRAWVDPDL